MTNETIIEKINEQVKRIIKETTTEYDKFKSYQLALTTKQVFENAYKINSINDLYFYFNESGFSDMINHNVDLYKDNLDNLIKIYNNLLGITGNIMTELYEKHFDYESLYTNLWEDIELLIQYVYFDNYKYRGAEGNLN